MKSKTTSIIAGLLFLLIAFVSIVQFGLIVQSNLINGGKLFVILLSNWVIFATIIFEIILAFALFKDELSSAIMISLIGLLVLNVINFIPMIKTNFASITFIIVMQILALILPKILLLVSYFKCNNNDVVTAFYLPALIYFACNIVPTVASISAYNGLFISPQPIMQVLSYLLTTLAYFTLGAYFKKY